MFFVPLSEKDGGMGLVAKAPGADFNARRSNSLGASIAHDGFH
jgi:hypothetical protein